MNRAEERRRHHELRLGIKAAYAYLRRETDHEHHHIINFLEVDHMRRLDTDQLILELNPDTESPPAQVLQFRPREAS